MSGEAYLPANMEETVLNTLVMLMGIVVMAFLVGELSNILGNFDPVGNEFEQTVDDQCQTSSALQFVVSRGRSEVLLAPRGRVYRSEIVSEFGPKTWPRRRDRETRPLSRGKKRGTRRVDGVEGSMTLSDAVDATSS